MPNLYNYFSCSITITLLCIAEVLVLFHLGFQIIVHYKVLQWLIDVLGSVGLPKLIIFIVISIIVRIHLSWMLKLKIHV